MDFSRKVIELRKAIRKFMKVHHNPHDTSRFDSFADQLSNLDTTLKGGRDVTPVLTQTNKILAPVGEGGTNNVNDVKVIQQLLNDQGTSLTVDGDIGPATIDAIKEFQAGLGTLNPDGRIDPNGFTWGHLIAPKSNTEEISSSESTDVTTTIDEIQAPVGKGGINNVDDVKIVQQLLNDKGASLSVDGDIGSATINAIKEFQASLGTQNPDGRVDPNGFTWKHLIDSKPNTENNSSITETTTDVTSIPQTINNPVGKNGVNDVDDVKVIQQLFRDKGASLDVDGDAGSHTIEIIIDFQKSIGIKNPDGRIDPDGFTWQELNKKTTPTGDGTPSDSSEEETTKSSTQEIKASVGKNGDNNVEDVKVVQELLHGKGHFLDVDGVAGSGTTKAIIDFQSVIGLPDLSGRVEPNSYTWKKLSAEGSHSLDKIEIRTGEEPLPEELSVTSKIKKSVGQKGINLPEDVLLVQKLLNKFNFNLEETPTVTIPLLSAIKRFQKEYGGSARPDGRIDPNGRTWNTLLGIGRIRGGIYDVAKKYGVEPAVILAIQAVESGGNGFLLDGRPKILFEGHIFWRELKKIGKDPTTLRPGNENILYPKWVKSNYKYNEKEYDRLAEAKKIDKIAALKSASWGEFQIMGFNHASAGYSDVEKFVEAMYKPGANQLSGLMGFLKENKLLKHVQGDSKNWAALARGYNGPAYAKNKYDVKLQQAYDRFSKIIL